MKNLFAIIFLAVSTAASAQTFAGGQVSAKNTKVAKDGKNVTVSMDIILDKLHLDANEGLVLTPALVKGQDTLRLPAMEVMGRKRYIYYQRNGKTATVTPSSVTRRHNGKQQTVPYNYSTDFRKWMRGANLIMGTDTCGCTQELLSQGLMTNTGKMLGGGQWNLSYAFAQPTAEAVKHRAEEGSAHLNFVLDRYDIRRGFKNNDAELEKIRQTVDLVRNDRDVTLTGISLHGYASPDGSYRHNETLARNRTDALATYLKNYYPSIDKGLFSVKSTAEDWDSVRTRVAESTLAERDALLDIIDSRRTPDEKDRAIASRYGNVYRSFFLDKVYPDVRRTDYVVTYNVRNFNLEEARQIIKTRPQKLSQNEMYLVANSYEKGSKEFCEVFDIAVRMFPSDPLANLNAALASLQRGDTESAEKFLERASDSAEADNARGILALKKEDYATAKDYFRKAADAGLSEAKANLDEMDRQGE